MAAGTGQLIEQANDELLRILDRSRADLAAKLPWPAITPSDHAERDAAALVDVQRKGSAVLQKDFLRADGERVPVLAVVAATNLDPYEWVAIVIDLGREERLRRLVQSEAAIVSTLLEDAPIGFALIDPELRFVRINQELAAMNGFSVVEHEGRPVFDLLPGLRTTAEPLLREVLETGTPLRDVEIVGTTPADPRVEHTWLESFFPVRAPGGPTIGVAAVARDVTKIRDLERKLQATLHRQRQILRDLQSSLLPTLPAVTGVELAARYLGASEEIRLGGDWFDAFPTSDGRLVLAIGDVVGHGPAAVGLMARLSGAMRAYVTDGHGPGEVLTRLNRLLVNNSSAAMASAALLAVDLSTGAIHYASAGHPYGLLCDPRRGVTVLDEAQGPILGAIAQAAYPTGTSALKREATALLYTDGLIERRGEDLDEGTSRLIATVVNDCRSLGAARLVDTVLTRSHTVDQRDDDVCVLAATRTATAPDAAQH